ncbi:MAG TPA: hypothetical protein GXX20_07725 [Clostridiaceae bacterium]|nr:hypothetical protein [Clostridiaceae bacterium]
MIVVIVLFAILVFKDFQRFIREKEQAKVYVIYILFLATSLAISLLLAAGIRPSSPPQWIEAALKMMGVLK